MGRFLKYLILMLGIIVMPSCNDEVSSAYNPDTLYDIVSLVSNNGNTAVFQLCKNGDSPLVTLTANNVDINDSIYETGSRILLAYIPKSGIAYQDDEITVVGITQIFNDVLRVADISIIPWDRDHITLYSIWRTRNYINIYCKLTYATTPSTFALILDESTAGNEYPDLYMSYQMQDEVDNFERSFYASIDIASLWNNSSCKGVNIHLNNANLDQNTFTFDKSITNE